MDPTVSLIWKLFPPIYIAVGTLGNIFVITLFFRRSIRKTSGSVVMASSSVIDLFILYTSLLDKWMTYGLHRPPLPDLLCKLQVWFASSFRMLEPWFLVLMTVERTILVLKPFRSLGQTKSKAREMVKILILVSFIILLNSHMMYGLTNGKPLNHYSPDRVQCYLKGSPYIDFFYDWIIFLSLSSFILPSIVLFILDTTVLIRLGKCFCRASNRNMRTPNTSVTVNASRSLNMILVMNLIFLVTTFPMAVIIITQTYNHLLFAVSNALLYIRNAIGFFSFLANGHFRKELLDIYRKYAFSWFRVGRKNAIIPITENP